MQASHHDTIVACATAPGRGGIGVVRVSGPRSEEILAAIAPSLRQNPTSHHLYLTKLQHPKTGVPIDESLVVIMRAPHSFTAEDCVEFQCHGGRFIIEQIIDAALYLGARIANAGEFTQRAYVNGRLDLTQAEAVADLINASNATAHQLAIEHLDGALGDKLSHYRALLTDAMVLVESAIDFAHEEDVYSIEYGAISARLQETLDGLRHLRDTFDRGRRQREGLKLVLLGATNAGKSTLFNTLYGNDRAIVTPIPGTTRDFLEEEISLNGYTLRLIDTAGLRETTDIVEQIGVGRSREQKASADIALWVVDGSAPLPDEVFQELSEVNSLKKQEVIVVVNKSDLPQDPSIAQLGDLPLQNSIQPPTIVHCSLLEQRGLEKLYDEISAIAARLISSEGVLISRARHLHGVLLAISALERAEIAVNDKLDYELIALDLREALDAIGSIVGHVSTDDILHKIFAEFCIGK